MAQSTTHSHTRQPSTRLASAESLSPSFDQLDTQVAASDPSSASKRSLQDSARQQESQTLSRQPSQSDVSFAFTDSEDTVDGHTGMDRSRSSGESIASRETVATSVGTLHALQVEGPENSDAQQLEPLLEDDPKSWDLVAPPDDQPVSGLYTLEQRAILLFSSSHLQLIFDEPKMLLRFTAYLNSHRPSSIPILTYCLDAMKAVRAIKYANAIVKSLMPLKGHDFTEDKPLPTAPDQLEEKAGQAFDLLVREDLPAYVAHIWVQVVSASVQRRITGTLPPHLRQASEGLAEVFCLTDPRRPDNPIVFASDEFTFTTQYGLGYAVGRNCRFLQGPRTSPHAVRRLAQATAEGREHTEVFVNYRRDGSPFMNLLMIAPLIDSRGTVRYFIGAQVDVSGLLKESSHLDAMAELVRREAEAGDDPADSGDDADAADHSPDDDPLSRLSMMFTSAELETVRRAGGRISRECADDSDRDSIMTARPRLVLQDASPDRSPDLLDMPWPALPAEPATPARERRSGKLAGIYQHYLLLRPAPSLRILFASPAQRVPGMLQSPFLHRIGGSRRVRRDLAAALAEGRGVTARIRWLARPDPDGDGDGRLRWIHCTPLRGCGGAVGVWMVVLVDDDTNRGSRSGGGGAGAGRQSTRDDGEAELSGGFRPPPPVADVIGGKRWDAAAAASAARERKSGGVTGSKASRGSGHSAAPEGGVAARASARDRGRFRGAEEGTASSGDGMSGFSFQLY